ncbi:MAG: hypothetical protein ABFD91_03710 [Anaerohalosphaeraceae bacterium]
MIGIILLAALIKLVLVTERPWLCAGLYAAISFVLRLCFGASLGVVLLHTAIVFGLVGLYFWLLDRYSESGLFWLILIVGLVIGFV